MIDILNAIYEFLFVGIYDFVVEAYAWLIIKIMTIRFYILLESIKFSYAIAQSLIQQLDLSSVIQSHLSSLPVTTQNQLNFFNVIEGLNILLSSAVTHFVMRFRS